MDRKTFFSLFFLFTSIYCENHGIYTVNVDKNETFICTQKIKLNIQNVTSGKCGCNGTENLTTINCRVDDAFGDTLAILHKHGYSNAQRVVLDFIEPKRKKGSFDMRPFSYFTYMRVLEMLKGIDDLGPVHLLFENTTFYGCNKLNNVRINIPLDNTYLDGIIRPLEDLETLNLDNVRSLGSTALLKSTENLSRTTRTLLLSRFQNSHIFGYHYEFSLIRLLHKHVYGNLREIDLSHNEFQVINHGWFKYAPHLVKVNVSNNFLAYWFDAVFFVEMLMHSTLEEFTASDQFDPFAIQENNGKEHFVMHELPKIHMGQSSTFTNMPLSTLRCINEKSHGNISLLFSKQQQYYCNMLQHCMGTKMLITCELYLPDLYDLIDFNCEYWLKFPLGPRLRTIKFENIQGYPIFSNLTFLYGNNVCVAGNRLEELSLSNNARWWKEYPTILSAILNNIIPVVGLGSLENLDISNNDVYIQLNRSNTPFPALKQLNMSGNTYIEMLKNTSLCRDKGLKNLTTLDLSASLKKQNSKIVQFYDCVAACVHLKELYLQRNGFDSSFFIRLENVGSMELVDLSYNNFETIGDKFATILDNLPRTSNVKIDLSNNPLSCDCSAESIAFVKWLNSKGKTRIKHFTNLTCRGEAGEYLLHEVKYIDLWSFCHHFEPIIITLAVSIGIGILISVCRVMYRRRFRLQYSCFKLQQRISAKCLCGASDENEDAPENYEYDAFVSYSSDDRHWVHYFLMEKLEDVYGFKLFIHYRDILPGQPVQQTIDDLIGKSREFIIVVTENYLTSDWCQMEMEGAYRESLRRHTSLAVIVLGQVPQYIENPTARLILDTYNYLQWKDVENNEKENDNKQKLFWAKLVNHLYGGKGTCACCFRVGPRSHGYREVVEFAEQHDPVSSDRENENENHEYEDSEDFTSHSIQDASTVA